LFQQKWPLGIENQIKQIFNGAISVIKPGFGGYVRGGQQDNGPEQKQQGNHYQKRSEAVIKRKIRKNLDHQPRDSIVPAQLVIRQERKDRDQDIHPNAVQKSAEKTQRYQNKNTLSKPLEYGIQDSESFQKNKEIFFNILQKHS